jgi:hypothetical protein
MTDQSQHSLTLLRSFAQRHTVVINYYSVKAGIVLRLRRLLGHGWNSGFFRH